MMIVNLKKDSDSFGEGLMALCKLQGGKPESLEEKSSMTC